MYYQRHPYNVVRLTYGKDEPEIRRTTTATPERRSISTLAATGCVAARYRAGDVSLRRGVCLPDGSQRERQGLIALCRLEPYERGIVLPHEETSPHPKRMLFDLRSAVEANLDQVFALYADDRASSRRS